MSNFTRAAEARSSDTMTACLPISIGFASNLVVADCIRKWSNGAALTERERTVVDQALSQNRIEMIQAIFHDAEVRHGD
jgi:hypothetical protein